MEWLWIVGATVLLSYGLGFVAYSLLKKYGVIDRPNDRSSHDSPTVRGGGIGFMAVLAVFGFGLAIYRSEVALALIIGLALLIAVVSMVDDLRSLGASVRFGTHFLGALGALLLLRPWTMVIGLGDAWVWTVPVALAWALGVLWIAGYTNAFNFMDGINGISGIQAAITAFGMALVAGVSDGVWSSTPQWFAVAIAGAVLGFLPHNFPKARMFMGDVGSAALGFLLAVLALWLAKVHGPWLLLPLVLLHANYLLDTGSTLVRRIAKGEKWYEPHREHFYQRYIRAGRSHAFVTGWEMVLQLATLSLVALYSSVDSLPLSAISMGLIVIAWASFYWRAEIEYRRSQSQDCSLNLN